MNQSGKTSAEPPRVESKRERRRGAGAATRAAVLRRAPSDSDCSGETASLSADSGDRLPRHNPPPARTANARSRRRGSEWEVLEGLKDGQRFEARPDVFNGYLHKKRKWPLKGWHKRFFVIDGGILVYARSAADVARGRLHGSVDVGLSVLSAKARRRRIDIDADEFIYHLRAKTHDVFRTWLNVLKTHRLYRQHLLTFGARESLPKIQAPADDAPHTDSSSRTSANSSNLSECSSEVKDHIQAESSRKNDFIDKVYNGRYPIDLWQNLNISQDNVRTYESMEQIFDVDIDTKLCQNQCSMCSLKCVSRRVLAGLKTSQYYGKSKLAVNQSNSEAQMATTNSDQTKLSKLTNSLNKNRRYIGTQYSLRDKLPTTACFFFTRKKQSMDCRSVMRRSKKCTNLVKYKNVSEEPPLKQPSSKCMLLSESAFVRSTRMQRESKCKYKMDVIPKTHKEVQIISNRVNQASQNVMTIEDMDEITESLMNKIFKYRKNNEESDNMKYYVDYVVKELYDVKVDLKSNPAKTLFRTLLEFWIRNTTGSSHSNSEFITTSVKATDVQSHNHLTQDVKISAKTIKCIEKETQYQDMNKTKNQIRCPSENHKLNHPEIRRTETQKDTDSFLKERRIQELERLLKNTVYVCETTRNSFCLDKDIQITKKLLNNLKDHPNYNTRGSDEKYKDKSSSSSEVPQIQDTINNLIQDTALPKDIAKEFLGAYLGILLNDKQVSEESQNTRSSDWSTNSKLKPNVQVMAEPVVKRLSKSVSPVKENAMVDDKSGNVYLRNILQKLTHCPKVVKEKDDKDKQEGPMIEPKDELGRPVKKIEKNNLICEQCDDNSLVVDLSKYNLQEITMVRDPCYKDIVSITIKLKDKPPMIGESKQPKIVVKLSEQDNPAATNMGKVDYWMTCLDGAKTISSESLFKALPNVNKPVKEISPNKDTIPLKPYKSEATSKGYIEYHKSDSESSIVSKGSRNNNPLDMTDDDPQCYMMTSFKKCSIPTTFQTKKKVKLKNNEPDNTYNTFDTANKPEELTIFEKPAPTIIDEKFILLLLENLTLLSKNVPAIYKDINNLFCKLKKKHEKTIKNAANIQGLSLLGKIYNEEYIGTFTKTIATQYDPDALVYWNKEVWTDTAVKKSDKELGTMELRHCVSLQITLDESKYYENMIEVASTSKDIEHHDRKIGINESTSVPYWLNKMLTKECAINTLLKYALDNENTNKFSKFFARPITNVDDTKKYLDKFKHVLWKEIMSPIPRVSTHAQTDKRTRLNTVMHEMEYMNKGNKNFDVYTMHWTHNSGHTSSMTLTDVSDDLKTIYRCISEPSYHSGLISPTTPIRGPQAGFVSGTPGGRLAGWIIESGGPLEGASRELGQAQLSVQQLQRLLDALELQQQLHHDTDVSLEGASPNVKKDRRKFGLRKKKSSTKCASVELQPPHIDPSASHTALSALTAPPSPGGGASSIPNSAASLPIACAAARPQSLPGAEALGGAGPASLNSLTPDHQLREDFNVLAKDLVASLKGIVSTLICERGRLRAAMEAADSAAPPGGAVVAALRTNLTSALQQNSELRTRLSRIHDASDIAEMNSVGNNSDPAGRPFAQSLSYSSSCVSASEFFDAEEHTDEDDKNDDIAADEAGVIELDGDSSSEAGSLSSEEGSASNSDNSDGAMVSAEAVTLRADGAERLPAGWARRTRLPAPRPAAGGPSLWNLLYKNIGKDLSQISMPVTINEPLNMLQRLCEELEYCELLDAAARAPCAVQRCSLVAAFAVSAYAAAAHRAASKPFNPLLAETYECVRDDKGFRFLAEQVSHHPPISACHAESARWCFWQEARIKTKFWGKSMEFQPTGRVHVRLNTTGDHYTWNKVTTCVHNLFGGQRWVDQYGDMHIACLGTDITCKLSFIKASSWSHSRHEVRGAVAGGGARVRLAGTWSEALTAGDPPAAKCLWRPGAMPPSHEMYYGFTRFAMELNELEPGMKEILPHTDTRLRPDQRALEEGDVDSAETLKHELEQAQRERRRDNPHHTPAWFRKTVENGEETWVFSGEYWKARENGFPDNAAPRIW